MIRLSPRALAARLHFEGVQLRQGEKMRKTIYRNLKIKKGLRCLVCTIFMI
jgi:hypothetical protein